MHNEVKVKIGKLHLDVVCLVENKVWREVGSTLLEMLFSWWGYEIAYSSNDLGRIWVIFFLIISKGILLRKKQINYKILACSNNMTLQKDWGAEPKPKELASLLHSDQDAKVWATTLASLGIQLNLMFGIYFSINSSSMNESALNHAARN